MDINRYIFDTVDDVKKCLNHIKLHVSVHKYAMCYELPYDLRPMFKLFMKSLVHFMFRKFLRLSFCLCGPIAGQPQSYQN